MTENEEAPEVTLPKPSWLLIVFSVINILAGVAEASVMLVGFEYLWPNPASYQLLLISLVGVCLVVLQYSGTFRRNANAALGDAFVSGLCYGMILLFCITMDFLRQGALILPPGQLAWSIVFAATIVSLAMNGFWFWKLKQHFEKHPTPSDYSISMQEVLACLGLLGLIILPVAYQVQANQSIYRENVSAIEVPFPVPEEAKAIRYQRDRNGLIVAASYEIDEADLKDWLSRPDSEMRKHGAKWSEINKPYEINLPDPTLAQYPTSMGHVVTKGIRVIWKVDNVYYATTYDRTEGLAIYQEVFIPQN
ncbi:hypothetical protein GC197_13405 [bacterium]|nr:hypothetical protein [bacterium]